MSSCPLLCPTIGCSKCRYKGCRACKGTAGEWQPNVRKSTKAKAIRKSKKTGAARKGTVSKRHQEVSTGREARKSDGGPGHEVQASLCPEVLGSLEGQVLKSEFPKAENLLRVTIERSESMTILPNGKEEEGEKIQGCCMRMDFATDKSARDFKRLHNGLHKAGHTSLRCFRFSKSILPSFEGVLKRLRNDLVEPMQSGFCVRILDCADPIYNVYDDGDTTPQRITFRKTKMAEADRRCSMCSIISHFTEGSNDPAVVQKVTENYNVARLEYSRLENEHQ